MGYSFRVIGSLRIGAQVVYFVERAGDQGLRFGDQKPLLAVMPNVKWNWLNLKIVSFYTRVGAGASFAKAKVGGQSDKSTLFAFQVSPVGVEVGGRVAAYAEAGIGTSGSLLVGVALPLLIAPGIEKRCIPRQDAGPFRWRVSRGALPTPAQALFRPSRSASCRRC